MSSEPPSPAPHIGAMLRIVSNRVRDEVYAGVVADGFDDLNPSHLAMFRYPGLDGAHPTQMAAELQITKQAVNQLIGHLERHSYIVREFDPSDGRGRVIRLTERGDALEAAVHAHARVAEDRIAAVLGPDGFAALHAQLAALFRETTRLADRGDA